MARHSVLWCEICWLLLLFLIFDGANADKNNVYSCGGFAKSSVPIKFERIQIRLLTMEGNLKYETECTPNSGYYVIPIYNKGVYAIRILPPPGWTFEPEIIDVKVDGETDPCSLGQDINFVLKGFAVNGFVRSTAQSNNGPAGFALSLVSDDNEKRIIANTMTAVGGEYQFNAVMPGSYWIRAVEGKCVSRGGVAVRVPSERFTVDTDLLIAGFALSGSVHSRDTPIADVLISLFSKLPIQLANCKGRQPEKLPQSLKSFSWICSVESDSKGQFAFPCVTPGEYSLLATYSAGDVHFDISPSIANVVIDVAPLELKFELNGFSVRGRVMSRKDGGVGLKNVEILVNGKTSGQTDADGSYQLQHITDGRYAIEARLADATFEPLNVDLSVKNAKIPDLLTTGFNLCGQVKVDKELKALLTQRSLVLSADDRSPISIKTNADGIFCQMVPPGRYILTPSILREEKETGLVLSPSSVDVDLSSGPVKNIVFTPFRANLHGQVQCLNKCEMITLKLVDVADNREVKSLDINGAKEQLVEYEMTALLPGTYKLRIIAAHRCWEHDEQQVVIAKNHLSDVNFRQTGFRTRIEIADSAKLMWSLSGAKQVKGSELLSAGTNSLCLPLTGKYIFVFESCHRYERDQYEYDTERDTSLSVRTMSHLVTGTVTLNKVKIPTDGPTSIEIIVKAPNAVNHIDAELIDSKNDRRVYNFQFYANRTDIGSELTITPVSDLYLFAPTRYQFTLSDECRMDAVKFVGEMGIFLDGAVEPSLDAVIHLTHNSDPTLSHVVNAGHDGRFRIGPLRNIDDYQLHAVKLGYELKQDTTKPFGQLHAFKLSQLTIEVTDSASQQPLSEVLISLSGGGANYRSNNQTGADGRLTIIGLSPGEYFLRPVLQEYRFDPVTKTVNIREGQTETVQLRGNRVAFSCYGNVRYLAGQDVADMKVEAVSEECNQLQEEDVTDSLGQYRIRGLQPSCRYRLSLKHGAQQQNKAYPSHYNVMVTDSDARDMHFVLRPVETTMELSGRVSTNSAQHLSTLKLVLYRYGNVESAVQTIDLQASSMFFLQNVPIDGAAYVLRLETSLKQAQYEPFDLPKIVFNANSSFRFLTLKFHPQRKPLDIEISRSSYIALPFVLLLAILGYNYAKVVPILQTTIDRLLLTMKSIVQSTIANRATNTISSASLASDSQSDSIGDYIKKRPKIRKT